MDKKKQRNAFVVLGGFLIVLVLIFALGTCSKAYSVSFDTDGGTDVSSLTVNRDGTITRPENPVKEGFSFVYWELNGEEFDFSTPITSDIILEAKWEAITFTINFDANGGSEVEDQVVAYNERIQVPDEPLKEGFDFLGWFSNDEEFDFSQVISEDVELVAKWVDVDSIVTTLTETKTSVIRFKTIEEKDGTLEVGKTVVKQNGVNGELTITYTVTYTDNVETDRKEVSRTTTKQPIDKIVLVGTKKVEGQPVVTTKTETETAVVAFKTFEQNDNTLEVGKTVVKQNGVNGEETITYTVTYTDGIETNRVEVSSIVTKEPVDKIILVGTKEPSYTFDVYQPSEFLGSPQVVVRVYKNNVEISAKAVYMDNILLGDNNNDKGLLLVDKSLVDSINRAQLTNGTYVTIQGGR